MSGKIILQHSDESDNDQLDFFSCVALKEVLSNTGDKLEAEARSLETIATTLRNRGELYHLMAEDETQIDNGVVCLPSYQDLFVH